jgi:hypothetical protein
MKKLGIGIAMVAALMLTVALAMQDVRAAQQKTLAQGFSEELGKIGKPAEKAKPAKKAKKKAAKKADKKTETKKDDKKKDEKKK